MRSADSDKYLSMYLAGWMSESLSESVSVTVSKRLGLASREMKEIRPVIEKKGGKFGTIEIALNLW